MMRVSGLVQAHMIKGGRHVEMSVAGGLEDEGSGSEDEGSGSEGERSGSEEEGSGSEDGGSG